MTRLREYQAAHRRRQGIQTELKAKHPKSPMGDTRNQPAPCWGCFTPTWNICSRCNKHCPH